MRTVRSWLVRWLVAAAIALAACGGRGDAEGWGTGVVRGVDAAAAKITLEHGDIPGVMEAMTMTFEVADPARLEGIEVGREVSFRVRYAGGKYTVIELAPR